MDIMIVIFSLKLELDVHLIKKVKYLRYYCICPSGNFCQNRAVKEGRKHDS